MRPRCRNEKEYTKRRQRLTTNSRYRARDDEIQKGRSFARVNRTEYEADVTDTAGSKGDESLSSKKDKITTVCNVINWFLDTDRSFSLFDSIAMVDKKVKNLRLVRYESHEEYWIGSKQVSPARISDEILAALQCVCVV